MNGLYRLFKEYTGSEAENVRQLTGSGSNRTYCRMEADGRRLMGVKGVDAHENEAFITIARHFHECGIPVPQVLAVSADMLYYLQEDLGDTLLSDMVAAAGTNRGCNAGEGIGAR